MNNVNSATAFLTTLVLAATLSGCSGEITANSWKLDAGSKWNSIKRISNLVHLKGRDEALVFGAIKPSDSWTQSRYVSQLKDNSLGKLAVLSGVGHITDIVPNPTDTDSVVVLGAIHGSGETFLGVLKANGEDDFSWQSFKVKTHSRPELQKIVAFGDNYCVVGGVMHPQDYAYIAFDLKQKAALNVLWTKRQRLDWNRDNNATDEFYLLELDSMARVGDNTLIVASTVVSEANNDLYAAVLCSYQVSREGMAENWCQLRAFDEGIVDTANQIYAVDNTDTGKPELVLVGTHYVKHHNENVMIEHMRATDGFVKAAYYWRMDVQTTLPSAIRYAQGTDNDIVEVGGRIYSSDDPYNGYAFVLRYDVNTQQLDEIAVWNKSKYIDAMTVSSSNEIIYVGPNALWELVAMTSTDCFDEHIPIERVTVDAINVSAVGTVLFGDYFVEMVPTNTTLSFSYLNTTLSTTLCSVDTFSTTTDTETPDDNDGGHNGHSLNGGAIAGIVVGIVAAMFILVLCVRYVHSKSVMKQEPYQGLVDE